MNIALFAHAGHGTTEAGTLAHHLTEPLHVGVILLGLVAVSVAAWVVRRRSTMHLERAKR